MGLSLLSVKRTRVGRVPHTGRRVRDVGVVVETMLDGYREFRRPSLPGLRSAVAAPNLRLDGDTATRSDSTRAEPAMEFPCGECFVFGDHGATPPLLGGIFCAGRLCAR